MKDMIKDATEKAKAKRLAYVVAQHNKGTSYIKIAEFLGVSRQRIHQILKEAGVK